MDPVQLMIGAFRGGHKLLICGNGGSSAQASHFAAELVVRYRRNRIGLPAIALNDPAILTACANDLGFDTVFERQVLAYGRAGDVLVAISTSGKSANVLRAVYAAAVLRMHTLVLTGPADLFFGFDEAPGVQDLVINAPAGMDTAAIQEWHMQKLHDWARMIEDAYCDEVRA